MEGISNGSCVYIKHTSEVKHLAWWAVLVKDSSGKFVYITSNYDFVGEKESNGSCVYICQTTYILV